MLGIFNSFNFNVYRGSDPASLYRMAKISYSEFEYGRQIKFSNRPSSSYMSLIYSSFGPPSFTIENTADGPVDCWVISSQYKHEIIYIEYWKYTYPQRVYIFFNVINDITSSFLKSLYENSDKSA